MTRTSWRCMGSVLSRLTAVVLNDQDLLRVPCCSSERSMSKNEARTQAKARAGLCHAGHAQPSVRLGDLVRQHDRLSSKDVSPAAGQVPWRQLKGFLRLAGLPVGWIRPARSLNFRTSCLMTGGRWCIIGVRNQKTTEVDLEA